MRRVIVILLASLAHLGCALDPLTTVDPPSIEALYDASPTTMLTPWPSDRFTVADSSSATGLRVHIGTDNTADPMISAFAQVSEQLNAMDGFSTAGGVVFGFSGPIDIRGIVIDEAADPPILDPVRDARDYASADAPLLIMNVDPASPERGKLHGIVPRWWAQAKDRDFPMDEFTLLAQPAEPLLPGTRYLGVVTSALKAADGGRIGRSRDMEDLLAGRTSDAYADELGAAIEELEASAGVQRDDVVLATVFTTAHVTDELFATAKAARSQPAPPLLSPWEIETPTSGDGRVRFRAVFETPEYRRPLPVGTWQVQDGAAVPQSKAGLEVFLAFADATEAGPRPVVIYQHGLGGDKDGSWGTAQRLAELGVAVIAIDSPEHGSRAAVGVSSAQAAFRFFGVDPDTNGFDITRARDNFRQMALDQLELVRLVDSLGSLDLLPVGAPDGVPDLDVSKVLYIGHSFGSVQGATVFALSPEIKHAVWNVGGANLMSLLRDSGLFRLLLGALKPPNTPDGAMGRFIAMSQGIVDPGDAINYARFGALSEPPDVVGWEPRDMLIQEVIDDGIVPNSTSEALARAAGLESVQVIRKVTGIEDVKGSLSGNLPGGATGALAQFDRMNGNETAEHGGLIFSPESRTQYVEFFKSALASGHATAIPAYPSK